MGNKIRKIRYIIDRGDKKSSDTVRFAAEELKKYIGYVTGDDIMLLEAHEKRLTDNAVTLGVMLSDSVHAVENRELDDAVLIDVKDGAGIITGSNARSVLISVYRYLREIGFEFFRPGKNGEKYPSSLGNESVYVSESASYRHRGICIEGEVSYDTVRGMLDWIPKASMNGYFIQFFVPTFFFKNWYTRENEYRPGVSFSEEDATELLHALEGEIEKRSLLYHGIGHGWTCKPLGLDCTGWYTMDESGISDEVRSAFALRNGKRELNKGFPINTNLCYGDESIRERVTDTIKDYCTEHPEVDYIHFWLADGSNNNCECDRCKGARVADHYVKMLNLLDEKLTAAGIKTKIVFLIYVDLLWAPEIERIKNKDRFVLMFAPISRTFTRPFTAKADGNEALEVRPYELNRLKFPRGAAESILYLKEWQKVFDGDSFAYDYYNVWDCFKEIGGTKLPRIIYEDIKSYRELGIGGLVSCQGQRVFLPSSLGMNVMARTLWNRDVRYADIVHDVFSAEYGEDADEVYSFLTALSDYATPEVLRGEAVISTDENRAKYKAGIELADSFSETLKKKSDGRQGVEKVSLTNLFEYIKTARAALVLCLSLASGEDGEAELDALMKVSEETEWSLREYYDTGLFRDVWKRRVVNKIKK